MKNGKNKGLTKGNKTKSLTVQARLEGLNLEKLEYLKLITGNGNTAIVISAISEYAISKGFQIN